MRTEEIDIVKSVKIWSITKQLTKRILLIAAPIAINENDSKETALNKPNRKANPFFPSNGIHLVKKWVFILTIDRTYIAHSCWIIHRRSWPDDILSGGCLTMLPRPVAPGFPSGLRNSTSSPGFKKNQRLFLQLVVVLKTAGTSLFIARLLFYQDFFLIIRVTVYTEWTAINME